jgi:hypothetical protein
MWTRSAASSALVAVQVPHVGDVHILLLRDPNKQLDPAVIIEVEEVVVLHHQITRNRATLFVILHIF